jgi:hypothetical protein
MPTNQTEFYIDGLDFDARNQHFESVLKNLILEIARAQDFVTRKYLWAPLSQISIRVTHEGIRILEIT